MGNDFVVQILLAIARARSRGVPVASSEFIQKSQKVNKIQQTTKLDRPQYTKWTIYIHSSNQSEDSVSSMNGCKIEEEGRGK